MELISSVRRVAKTYKTRQAFPAFLIAGLLSFSASAWAQISMVRVTSCSGTFPGTICTIPATANGNLIVVGIGTASNSSTTINGISDNAGNTYAEAGSARAVDTVANYITDIWYAKNSRSGATTVTITPSLSGAAAVVIWEFSNVDTSAPLDRTGVLNTQAATTTPSGAAITTTVANELIISILNPEIGATGLHAGNPFTSDSAIFSQGWAHLIASSPGTYSAQWDSQSGTYAASTVSFKPASAGGSPSSACDLATPYGIVDSADVNSAVNMVLNPPSCTANIIGPNVCNVVVVQRVINAMGGACVTGTTTVSTLSCVPSNVTAPGSSLCTVGLSAAAPTGGASVGLSSSIGAVTVPVSVTVPANSTSTTFTANVGSVSSNQTAILTASAAGVNRTFSLGVTAPAVSHSVSLSWTASNSAGVTGYNVYRGTSSGGPYSKINSSTVIGLGYTDGAVTSGQTYFYVATSVDVNGNESIFSTQAPAAAIP